MPYVPHSEKDIEDILHAVGARSVDEVFSTLPASLRIKKPLNIPEGLTEQDLKGALKRLGEKNATVEEYSSFLGAGAYNHYIPSVVDSLISRSEFYTSYTPYQPELSQGTLQAIFEYQTFVCQLTGTEVSNAGLYDGSTGVAEAVLMARRITGRTGVLMSAALHPEYRETVRTYLKGSPDSMREVLYCTETGITLPGAVDAALADDTACLVVQHPNFFGSLEEIEALAEAVHRRGGLIVAAVTEPISLGLLRPPGELGADIVVGENQSFGNPLNFGGPMIGFMATSERYLRQMPGRLVGETLDRNGKRAYCLTFATREQHIRREKATSNICTNENLCALASAIYLASLGRSGIKRLAHLNLSKAAYLAERLTSIKGVSKAFTSPFFNELTVKLDKDPETVLKALLKRRIIGGLSLKRFYPELNRHILVSVTEMNTREELDRFAEELSGLMG